MHSRLKQARVTRKFGKSREISLPGVLNAENCLLNNRSLMISIVKLFLVIIGGDNFPLNMRYLNLFIDGIMVELINEMTQLQAYAEI